MSKHIHPIEEEDQSQQEESEVQPNQDFQQLYLRAQAALVNTQKRAEQDRQNLMSYSKMDAALSILPVIDNFRRATEHIPEDQQQIPWVTGVLYIQQQLESVLEGWGVEQIPCAVGDEFNHDLQEAISTQETDEMPEDHVVTVQNPGYRLNGRVIRPVAVITSKPSKSEEKGAL